MSATAETFAELPSDRPAVNPWIIAVVVTMATFMEVLDTTIANVALPHIAGNLAAGQDESTWVLTSYLVSNAIVLPMSGWLSRAMGRKRFYMTCVALFTTSSLLCGLAPNLPTLIFFRVLQGLGGGGLQPSEQAILVDTFPASKRGMAFAVAGVATVCAPVLGPTLGGWITDNFSWRWIFYINVPIGALSLFLTSQLVPNTMRGDREDNAKRARIDWVGVGLVALGIGTLQVMLDKGEREDWFASSFIIGAAVVTALALSAAVVWLLSRKDDPLVDLHLMRDRNFAMANVLMFTLGFALFGSTVILPMMLQSLMGYDATWSGLVLSPGAIVVFFLMPIAGMLVSRVQPKFLISFGFLTSGFALLHMSGYNLQLDYHTAMMGRTFQVFGLAFLFIPVNTAAYASVPPGKNNNASALLSMSRNIGGSTGIAFVTTLIAHRAQFHHARLTEHITPYSPIYQARTMAMRGLIQGQGAVPQQADAIALGSLYKEVVRQSSMLAYQDAFHVLGVLLLTMIPVILLVMKPINLAKKSAGGH